VGKLVDVTKAMAKQQKTARELQLLVSEWLGIQPGDHRSEQIKIFALKDTWRAMSARHDDHPDFRNDVISASILLSERYTLED
jgi:hypothetical protein